MSEMIWRWSKLGEKYISGLKLLGVNDVYTTFL